MRLLRNVLMHAIASTFREIEPDSHEHIPEDRYDSHEKDVY
jgi:hypothetical protein